MCVYCDLMSFSNKRNLCLSLLVILSIGSGHVTRYIEEVVFQPEGYMTSKFILILLIVRGECLVLTKRLFGWLFGCLVVV